MRLGAEHWTTDRLSQRFKPSRRKTEISSDFQFTSRHACEISPPGAVPPSIEEVSSGTQWLGLGLEGDG